MDGLSSCPLHFVSNEDSDWFTKKPNGSEEHNELDLTLAPPGPQKWSTFTTRQGHETHDSLLSFSHHHQPSWPGTSAPKFLQFSPGNDAPEATLRKESPLLHCSNTSTKMYELQQSRNNNDAAAEKIGFLPSVSSAANTAVPQKRTAPGPVVGWPPLRSFRKNLVTTTSTTKPSHDVESQNGKHGKKAIEASTTTTTKGKGLFVKINMDGIPIGRKVDLQAYDSYEKLSSAVDKLFRGLLAAQTDSFANGIPSNQEVGKPITGLLDGSGEYTLVYEDNEGDRVLVGDVPWGMFVSTVKRLRVLKTSELPSMSLGGKQQKTEQPQ